MDISIVKAEVEYDEPQDSPDLVNPHLQIGNNLENDVTKQQIYNCSNCGVDFSDEFLLKVHEMIHDEQQYCFICKRTIHNNFEDHIMGKHFNQCLVCFKTFGHRRSLDNHMEHHTGELKYFKCDQCDKVFRQKGSLYTHVRSTHQGLKPFVCQLCDGTFTTSSSLGKHVRNVHNPAKPPKKVKTLAETVTCIFCSKELSDSKEKECHEKEHLDSKICKECGKGFERLAHLRIHLFRMHFKTEQCTYCSKMFHKTLIDKHVQMHELEKTKSSVCEICNVAFDKSSSLNKHLLMHKASERCLICGLFVKEHMEKHIQAHNEGKVGRCYICKRIVNDIQRHNDKVHRNTQYIFCSMCPEKFVSISERYRHHMKVHSKVKSCPSCKVKFESEAALQEHFKQYHPNNIFKCQYCPKIFFAYFNYKNHLNCHSRITKNPYKCSVCLRSYKTKIKLKQHKCFNKALHCHLCNKNYNCPKSYNRHMLLLHSPLVIADESQYVIGNMNILETDNKKLYQCKRCLRLTSLTKGQHFCGGKICYERKVYYKCKRCGFLSTTIKRIKDHGAQQHLDEDCWVRFGAPSIGGSKDRVTTRQNYLFKCSFCRKRFKYEKSLIYHRTRCTFYKPYHCKICDNRFRAPLYLKRHLTQCHVPKIMVDIEEEKNSVDSRFKKMKILKGASKKYKCKKCLKVLPSLPSFKKHACNLNKVDRLNKVKAGVRSQSRGNGKIKCEECGFVCLSQKVMRSHKKSRHSMYGYAFYIENGPNSSYAEENVICKSEIEMQDASSFLSEIEMHGDLNEKLDFKIDDVSVKIEPTEEITGE